MGDSSIVRFFAGAELFALSAFLLGYFMGFYILMMIGGILLVIQDIFAIMQGVLNPLFPVILAFVLAYIFSPWYVGIFWSIAAFTFLNIPTNIRRLKTGQLP
ncbi:MAG: hypothetical protein WD883_00540 [Candidatus Colwellbacteria bacterium]